MDLVSQLYKKIQAATHCNSSDNNKSTDNSKVYNNANLRKHGEATRQPHTKEATTIMTPLIF